MKHWPKPELVLIGRDGKEKHRIPITPHNQIISKGWIYYNRKVWGFGVGKVNGEQHFYEAP